MSGEKLLTRNTACLIERMTEHAKADEIIKGVGWDRGKGCFVGCCLHEYNHQKFPDGLGWPVELGYLCDGIFEGLSNADAKQFAVDVPKAVSVDGKDLSMVLPHFLFWLLTDPVEGVIRFVPADRFPQQHKAVSDVAELRRRQIAGEIDGPPSAAWDAARDAAWDAAGDAARAAAWDAAGAAARAAAGAAARAAAGAAAGDAAWDAARDAARAAAGDAARDAAWDAAGAAARAAARKQQAAKLIELLKAAPVVKPGVIEVQGKDELSMMQDKRVTRRIDQRYIGDGVTATYDGNGIMLKTPREDCEHYIYLEPEVLHSLIEFVGAIREEKSR